MNDRVDSLLQDFGPVWGAAGVNGFFGNGWEFHRRIPRFLRPDFTGMTDVYKTSTIDEWPGNTPLKGVANDYEPKELFPQSVYLTAWMWIIGVVLNAWGLSGPGFKALQDTMKWQQQKKPFMISFMPRESTPEKRKEEILRFKEEVARRLAGYGVTFVIQINASCPNAGVNPAELAAEVLEWLNILQSLGVRIVLKWAVDMPVEALLELEKHPALSGVCLSNSVKFGKLADRIPWGFIFPFSKESPLKRFGGGGLSGRYLLPLVEEYIVKLRKLGFKKHINAGGGILSWRDARRLMRAGANSVFIGSVAMLRPWRVQSIIRHMNDNYRMAAESGSRRQLAH